MNNNINIEYTPAPLSLLSDNVLKRDKKFEDQSGLIENTFEAHGVDIRVEHVDIGDAVTRYSFCTISRVRMSKILSLENDIAFALGRDSIRIDMNPNTHTFAIEVPNKQRSYVNIKELLTEEFMSSSPLTVAIGRSVAGEPIYCNIAAMPHILIAGTVGSGKSLWINSILTSILCKASPEDVKLLLIDTKIIELSYFNGIPHLLTPVITDPDKAVRSLEWATWEMKRRYELFAENSVRDIEKYNEILKQNGKKALPRILIIIDELVDLMTVAQEASEKHIANLASFARAAGIHMIVATQRPSVDVITSELKSSLPSRIAFTVNTGLESRIILDTHGAEALLGMGDMLYFPAISPRPIRVQGAFVVDSDVDQVVAFIKENNEPDYDISITNYFDSNHIKPNIKSPDEEMFSKAPREVYYSKTRPQNNNIGFEEDPIFLLSATEYEHYKNKIPFIQGLWWLRSPGNNFRTAASVFSSNNANYYSEIEYCSVIVRPAIKYSSLRSKITKSSCCNNRIIFMDHPFRIIDPVNEIAIAEVPIALNQFDVESNDYETSCVRRKLLKWFETGTWNYA